MEIHLVALRPCNSKLPIISSGCVFHPFLVDTYQTIRMYILIFTLSTLPLFQTVCSGISLKQGQRVKKIISFSEEAL